MESDSKHASNPPHHNAIYWVSWVFQNPICDFLSAKDCVCLSDGVFDPRGMQLVRGFLCQNPMYFV